uniref:Uncharacterized protein n=1 Tax=Phasianus colchicus TaxID=9054 RepID=A0A669PNW3_PHACC
MKGECSSRLIYSLIGPLCIGRKPVKEVRVEFCLLSLPFHYFEVEKLFICSSWVGKSSGT